MYRNSKALFIILLNVINGILFQFNLKKEAIHHNVETNTSLQRNILHIFE